MAADPPRPGLVEMSEKLTEAVQRAPAMRCPNCDEICGGVSPVGETYTIRVREREGKSHEASIPPCPVSGFETHPITYTAEPCGCRVTHMWASAFATELRRREENQQPKPVVDMTDRQRTERLRFLERKLAELYSLQISATTGHRKEAVDYWIVVVADQIQRTCPGAHNRAPAAPISEKVTAWAGEKGFTVPRVVIDTSRDGSTQAEKLAALQQMAQSGLASTESLAALFTNAATEADDRAFIRNTRSGQYGVHYKGAYRVFVDYELARAYAQAVSGKPPVLYEGPLPTQTDPYVPNQPAVPQSTDIRSMSRDLLRRIYNASDPGVDPTLGGSVVAAAFELEDGAKTGPLLTAVRDALFEYLSGRRSLVPESTLRFVRQFVSLVEIPPPPGRPFLKAGVQVVPGPVEVQTAAPPPPVDKSARRKRTFRRIEE